MTKIAYEPHPVTPERKAQLRAAGFIIQDVRFKPADAAESTDLPADPTRHDPANGGKSPLGDDTQPAKRRGRPPKEQA